MPNILNSCIFAQYLNIYHNISYLNRLSNPGIIIFNREIGILDLRLFVLCRQVGTSEYSVCVPNMVFISMHDSYRGRDVVFFLSVFLSAFPIAIVDYENQRSSILCSGLSRLGHYESIPKRQSII